MRVHTSLEGLVFLIVVFACFVWLQIFLSKKRDRRLGLIFPLVFVVFSLILVSLPYYLLYRELGFLLPRVFEEFDEYGNLVSMLTVAPVGSMGRIVLDVATNLLIYNIPTFILMSIRWICRKNNNAET